MVRISVLTVVTALLLIAAPSGAAEDDDLLHVKIQAINDLHGGIDSSRRVGNRQIGGAAYLATAMKERAAGHPHVLRVGAGDMLGASPAVSAVLQDEPTIRVLNSLDLIANSPGNHEFDEGIDEFFRLSHGGCHRVTGCFEGAGFKQISANIVVDATGEPLLAPYHVEHVGGVPVAFIGATHEDVPRSVVAGAVDGLSFPDPAASVNRYVNELQAHGVRAFVVLIHSGAEPRRNDGRIGGPFVQTVEALDPDVDLVVSAHTHQGYTARVAGKLVTQAYSYGSAFADIDLTIDRHSGDVVSSWAEIVNASMSGVPPDPGIGSIVADAQSRVAPLVSRVVGSTARTLTASQERTGESALGNLIADAFRWRTGAQIGMTNSGGIRAPLPSGPITWGQLFAVLPFGNELVSMDLSGLQLQSIFELQWTPQSDGSTRYRPLQVSGMRVIWDGSLPVGERIVSLTLEDGTPLEPDAIYHVTVNSFMAAGGDGQWIFNDGSSREFGVTDLEALVEYVEHLPRPIDSRVEGRLSRRD
jgi:5'-nucleotidase